MNGREAQHRWREAEGSPAERLSCESVMVVSFIGLDGTVQLVQLIFNQKYVSTASK